MFPYTCAGKAVLARLPKPCNPCTRHSLSEYCTPLVREITFENAEGLTEEGLPFLILFVAPGDTQSLVCMYAAMAIVLIL